MKKIIPLFVIFLAPAAHAATSNLWGPAYLTSVANAWDSIISDTGPSAAYAQRIRHARDTDMATFYDLISIIGNNDTAITLFETNRHINSALASGARPITPRHNDQRFLINASLIGAADDYDSDKNGDFKTQTTGISVNAQMYLGDRVRLGLEYMRSMTDTHHDRIYTDAVTNSLGFDIGYRSASGWFINGDGVIGSTRWANDKTIAGIQDSGDYDSRFFAGEINGGIEMMRGPVSITPTAGARYTFIKTDRHIDGAAQSFDKWDYQTLTPQLAVEVGYNFVGPDFRLRPFVTAGGGYDVLRWGDNHVRVRVLSGQFYEMPIDTPSRVALDAGLGLRLDGPMFSAALEYQLDVRRDYYNHNGRVTLKIAF